MRPEKEKKSFIIEIRLNRKHNRCHLSDKIKCSTRENEILNRHNIETQ